MAVLGAGPGAAERTALRVIAISFLGLAAFVSVDAVRTLLGSDDAAPSTAASSWPQSAWS